MDALSIAGGLAGGVVSEAGKRLSGVAGALLPSSPDAALKDALKSGMEQTCNSLSADGGFGKGEMRIPLPPEIEPVVSKLAGQGADGLGDKINSAAEQAVGKSKDTFTKAVDKVSSEELLKVLGGGERAGTELLARMARDDLSRQVEPVVKSVLSDAEKLLSSMLDTYHKIPLAPKVTFSLVAYVLTKTLEAIFKMLGDKEVASRMSNPILKQITQQSAAAANSPAGLAAFQVTVNGSMGKATKTDLIVRPGSVEFLKCASPGQTDSASLLTASILCSLLLLLLEVSLRASALGLSLRISPPMTSPHHRTHAGTSWPWISSSLWETTAPTSPR